MRKNLIPLPKALFFLIVSTTFISGLGYLSIQALFKKQAEKKDNSQALLTNIIQTGPQKEALKTGYLAEILNLSRDKPTRKSAFDLAKAQRLLLNSPVIKEAEVKFASAQTLYIAYTVRQPIARLYDIENAALDEEGFFFPLSPFFAPKTLPEIYLGLPSSFGKDWNQPLEGTTLPLALDLLRLLALSPYQDLFSLLRIDVSHAKDKSYGTREVVLLIEEPYDRKGKRRVFLRLTPKNYPQELGNYLELRKNLVHQPIKSSPTGKLLPQVVDLRIPQLAFIEN